MPRGLQDHAWAEVQTKIAEALAPFAADLGARTCAHEENWADCEHEDCEFGDTQPKADAMPMIQHFVLITSTVDMAAPAGQSPVMAAADPVGQPGYVSRGMALDFIQGN
jgi:hypothetical protein